MPIRYRYHSLCCLSTHLSRTKLTLQTCTDWFQLFLWASPGTTTGIFPPLSDVIFRGNHHGHGHGMITLETGGIEIPPKFEGRLCIKFTCFYCRGLVNALFRVLGSNSFPYTGYFGPNFFEVWPQKGGGAHARGSKSVPRWMGRQYHFFMYCPIYYQPGYHVCCCCCWGWGVCVCVCGGVPPRFHPQPLPNFSSPPPTCLFPLFFFRVPP